ncbi:hypothetical protein [Dasania marina]|uniref:hypothetical protein n=1 Tax=Dasania marina TaxID=471499 RepID=UPI0030DD9EB8|tara:strand:+ start:21673 stop:22344 length:672 start_codon:yes stop_codon:yes gene_type:complete
MDNYKLVNDELNLVIIGSFNPAIFHPEWFSKHGIISEAEAEAASLEVCHPDVAKFSTSWFALEVTQTRFLIASNSTSRSEEIRDIVVNVFMILSESPITALGINSNFEYRCKDVDSWHKVGHLLTPKINWLPPFPKLTEKDVGMRVVEVQYPRADELPGFIRVSVAPTKPEPSPELVFKVNSHIDFKELVEIPVSQLIGDVWEDTMDVSKTIVNSVLGGIDAN